MTVKQFPSWLSRSSFCICNLSRKLKWIVTVFYYSLGCVWLFVAAIGSPIYLPLMSMEPVYLYILCSVCTYWFWYVGTSLGNLYSNAKVLIDFYSLAFSKYTFWSSFWQLGCLPLLAWGLPKYSTILLILTINYSRIELSGMFYVKLFSLLETVLNYRQWARY